MAKDSIRDYSASSSDNSDIQSVDISEGCAPSGLNNAIREVMADLKDVSAGTVALETPVADSFSTDTISEKTSATGVTIDGVLLKDNTVTATSFTGNGSALTGLNANTPAFCATNSAQQTANINTMTKVQFDTEVFDSDGKYDTSNYRFTPTVAGKYFITAQIANNNLYNQANLQIQIHKNGSSIMNGETTGNNSTSNRNYTISTSLVVDLDTDDYVEIYGRQGLANGSAITEGTRCYFIGYKIA